MAVARPLGPVPTAVIAEPARGRHQADTIAACPDRPDDDLEARVRHLENEVLRLKDGVEISRADAAAARVLAGGADRDVSDMKTLLRAHTHTLTALRETQLDQQEILGAQAGELASLRTDLTSLDVKVDDLRSEMQHGFETVHTGLAQITALIRSIERRGEG